MTEFEEFWRPRNAWVPGTDQQYAATASGRIWSMISGRFLKGWLDKDGYREFRFRGGRNRKFHRTILESFVGPCPKGNVCRHLNGNPADNRLSNLTWGTRAENTADMIRYGRQAKPGARLNPSAVRDIRSRRKTGETLQSLADDYGVGLQTVQHVTCGNTWRDVCST